LHCLYLQAMAESRLPLYQKSLVGAMGSVVLFITFFMAISFQNHAAALDSTRQVIDMWIPLVSMGGTLYWIRWSRRPTYLHFWEGIITTGFVTLILSILSALSVYGYCSLYPEGLISYKVYLVNDYLPKIKDMTESIDPGSYKKLVETNKNLTALEMGYSELSRKFLICIVLSVILSLAFRKKSSLQVNSVS